MLTILVVGWLLVALPALAENVVQQATGTVEIGSDDPTRWRPARVGDRLAPGDALRTGADGRAEIATGAGTLRVFERSLLRLPEADASGDAVELERGWSLFDVIRRAGRGFEVRTPTVVVSVKGTRFGVDVGDEIGAVVVYRGVVGVRGVGDAVESLVREGFLATGGPGVPVELELAPAGDPWSTWSESAEVHAPGSKRDRPEGVARARRRMQRSTDDDVVREAAERRPEIAARLRDLAATRGEDVAGTLDSTREVVSGEVLPAALEPVVRTTSASEPVLESVTEEVLDPSVGAVEPVVTPLLDPVAEAIDPVVSPVLDPIVGSTREMPAAPDPSTDPDGLLSGGLDDSLGNLLGR